MSFEEKIEVLQNEIQATIEDMSSYEEENEGLKNEIDCKIAENATLLQRTMDAENKSEQSLEMVDQMGISRKELETSLTTCQEKVSSLEKENKKLNEELEIYLRQSLLGRVSHIFLTACSLLLLILTFPVSGWFYFRKLRECERLERLLEIKGPEKVSSLEKENSELREELGRINSLDLEVNAVREKDMEIQQLREELNEHEISITKIRKQLIQRSKENEELKREIKKRIEDNADILQKHLEEEKRVEELKAHLTQIKEEDEARLEQHQSQVSTLHERFENLEAHSKQEMGMMQAEIHRLTREPERLRKEVQQTCRKLEELQREKTQVDARNSQLVEQLEICQTKMSKFEAALHLKEAEDGNANERMQKAVREHQAMVHQVAGLQRVEQEKRKLEQDKQLHLDEITRLRSSLQETQHLRDYLQQYYKLYQDSQMELHRENEKNRHFNELLSTTGHRLDNMAGDLQTYRSSSENYRQLLEHEKERVHDLQLQIDRLTIRGSPAHQG